MGACVCGLTCGMSGHALFHMKDGEDGGGQQVWHDFLNDMSLRLISSGESSNHDKNPKKRTPRDEAREKWMDRMVVPTE